MPETHHIHGPSTLKNKAICPGWTNDKNSDTSFADEGTLLHHAAETGSLEGLTAEQVSCVQPCIALCKKLEAGALTVLKEHRLSILNGKTFGTCDRIIRRHRTHAEVLDFKFGRNDVDPAKENVQGWAYMLGVFEKWPELDTVRVWFALPRLDKVSSHTFSRKDLPKIRATVATIIDRCILFSKTENLTMLNPTEYGCLYCGKVLFERQMCPHMCAQLQTVVSKYAPLEVVDEVHSSVITDPVQMARLFTASKILEKMVESVKQHAMQLANEHGGLPGYEIAERAGTRKLRDLGLALPVLSNYLDDRELLSVADVSLSAALKLIAEKQPRGQKSKVLGEVEKQLSDAEAITSGEPSRYLKKIKTPISVS